MFNSIRALLKTLLKLKELHKVYLHLQSTNLHTCTSARGIYNKLGPPPGYS